MRYFAWTRLCVCVLALGSLCAGCGDEGGGGGTGGTTPGTVCSAEYVTQACGTDCSFEPASVDCAAACQRIADTCAAGACGTYCAGINQDVALCTVACQATRSNYCTNESFGCWASETTCDGVGTCFTASTEREPSGAAADTGTSDAGGDTAAEDSGGGDTGGGDTGGGGAGFFATFTVDGQTFDVACPDPDEAFEAPYLIEFYAGNEQNIGCAVGHQLGVFGASAAINFGDRGLLQDGAIDMDCCGGAHFVAKNPDVSSATLDSRAENLTSFTMTGTYDTASRRIVGSFSGEWAADDDPVRGAGSASGTFDIVLPE